MKQVERVRKVGFRLFNLGGRNTDVKKGKMNRVIIIFLVTLALVSMWLYSTFTLKVSKIEISSSKINDEITFVHITDLHGSSFGKDNKDLIRMIGNVKPDFIVCTGDMYTADSEKGEKIALDFLSSLAQEFPVYYINGEHDNSETFFKKLSDNKVVVLNYKEQLVTVKNTTLHLYGINNAYYSSQFDLSNEFVIDEENYTILLAHGSYFDRFAEFGIDLSLCGDTHGGQVRLPFIGAIQNSGIWFPELINHNDEDVKYTKGLYQKGNSKLFISSGLGNFPVPVRLFNQPEIVVVKLLPA